MMNIFKKIFGFNERKSESIEESQVQIEESQLQIEEEKVYCSPCPYCSCNYLIASKQHYYTDYLKKSGYVISCPNCGLHGPIKNDLHESANAWNNFVDRCNECKEGEE